MPGAIATMTRFANFAFYQIGWFACVLGVSWGFQWIGVASALCLVFIHLCLASDRNVQIKLALAAAAVGLIIDTAQLAMGVFSFPRGSVIEWLPPPFMTVLWLQFATTLRYCMSWLGGRYGLSAAFGLFGAPLAFFAGERLGAIEFLSPRLAHYTALGLIWSVSVPLLVYIADRLGARAGGGSEYLWMPERIVDS